MIDKELVAAEWSERVVPNHPVPVTLFPHQLDAMAMLKGGNHVLLGIHQNSNFLIFPSLINFRGTHGIRQDASSIGNYSHNARYTWL